MKGRKSKFGSESLNSVTEMQKVLSNSQSRFFEKRLTDAVSVEIFKPPS